MVERKRGLWSGKKPPLRKIPVLRNIEFLDFGRLDYEKRENVSVSEKDYKEWELEENDILLELSGGSNTQNIGRVALYEHTGKEYSFGNFIMRIRPKKGKLLLPKYLFEWMNFFYQKGGTECFQKGIRRRGK